MLKIKVTFFAFQSDFSLSTEEQMNKEQQKM